MLSLCTSPEFWEVIVPEIKKDRKFCIPYSKINIEIALINRLDSYIEAYDIGTLTNFHIIEYLTPLYRPKTPLVTINNLLPGSSGIQVQCTDVNYPGFYAWILDEKLINTCLAPSTNPMFRIHRNHKIDRQREIKIFELFRGEGYVYPNGYSHVNPTPILEAAAATGNTTIIETILKEYPKNTSLQKHKFYDDVEKVTMKAAEYGNLNVLKYIVEDLQCEIDDEVLNIAARYGYYDLVVWLCETVMHTANVYPAIVMSVFNDCHDIFLYLWHKYPNSSYHNNLLLDHAVKFNKIKVVKILIQYQRENRCGFFKSRSTARRLLVHSIEGGFVEISEFLYKISLELNYDCLKDIFVSSEVVISGKIKVPRDFRSRRMICKYRWIKHRLGRWNDKTVSKAINRSELSFVKWLHYNLDIPYDPKEMSKIADVDIDVILWLEQNRCSDLNNDTITAIIGSKDTDAINRIVEKMRDRRIELTDTHIYRILKTGSIEIFNLFKKHFPLSFRTTGAKMMVHQRLGEIFSRSEHQFLKFVCYEIKSCITIVYEFLGKYHPEWFFKDYICFVEKSLGCDSLALNKFYLKLGEIVKERTLQQLTDSFEYENKIKISPVETVLLMNLVDGFCESLSAILRANV